MVYLIFHLGIVRNILLFLLMISYIIVIRIWCIKSLNRYIILEVFINEVERQLDNKIKVVSSDSSDEYYDKFDKSL